MSSSEAKPAQPPTTTVTILNSRHSAHLSLSLSRYKRQWFLTYPRAYGMVAFPGQRIVCRLNTPDQTVDETYARKHFWFNADMTSQPYDPSEKDDESKRYISSPIHMLLDSETPIARLTGRTRAEKSNNYQDNGKEIVCHEVEVIMPDEGLVRQCYYCLGWEGEGEETRLTSFADETYWCESCQKQNTVGLAMGSFWQKLVRDKVTPTLDSNTFPRDSLYA